MCAPLAVFDPRGWRIGVCVWLGLVCLTGFGCKENRVSQSASSKPGPDARVEPLGDDVAQIVAVTDSEEFIIGRANQMALLQQWLQGDAAPPAGLFTDELEYSGLSSFNLEDLTGQLLTGDLPFASRELDLAGTSERFPPSAHRVWPQLTTDYHFESCQFGTTNSQQISDSQYSLSTLFEGRLTDDQQRVIGVKATQDLIWKRQPSGEWRLAVWQQTSFKLTASVAQLFRDVTEDSLPDSDVYASVRAYSHWELMRDHANQATSRFRDTRFRAFNDWESAYQYPCVSVLDWNSDGRDDLFLTDRWGPARLLENQGDGKFRDVTEASGLKADELTTCAVFADFDNDGDEDAFLGGSLGPSRFFQRTDQGFVEDKSLSYMLKDLRLVVSASVADINGDGLLDLYLATYGIGSGPAKEWIGDIVRGDDRTKLLQRLYQSHHFLDRTGPPNVLLMNRGGKLVRRKEIGLELEQWHFSYQPTWSDIDSDGDPDLYLCNDFAPDALLRNDTPRGSLTPIFTDVSREVIPDGQLGFGMGASWGDYNNDGQLDLYVSNMYSKAGGRILKKFPEAHDQIKTASKGNFLFENQGSTWKQVAGFGKNDQQVSKVGWSFGGQFADFDNDSQLDIYVPSGFYSPPPTLKKPGDS